jgi:hypothetical protein
MFLGINMKNYKDYIGKTFIGFEFEDKKHKLSYYPSMDDCISKVLVIEDYSEQVKAFQTNEGYWYPEVLVIEQLKKQESEKFKTIE